MPAHCVRASLRYCVYTRKLRAVQGCFRGSLSWSSRAERGGVRRPASLAVLLRRGRHVGSADDTLRRGEAGAQLSCAVNRLRRNSALAGLVSPRTRPTDDDDIAAVCADDARRRQVLLAERVLALRTCPPTRARACHQAQPVPSAASHSLAGWRNPRAAQTRLLQLHAGRHADEARRGRRGPARGD